MSDASGTTARAFSVGRLGVGMLSGAAGHGLAMGAGFLAGAGGERSAASGLEAAGAFLLVEALVFIAVVIAVVGLLAKSRRDLALGVFLGWLAGPAVVLVWRLAG